MSNMSGKDGDVLVGGSKVLEVTRWTMSRTSNNPAWNSNVSGGSKKRIAGVKDASGTLEGKLDTAKPAWSQIAEGSTISIELRHNATVKWTGSVIVSQVDYDVNIDTGDAESFTCNWEQAGAMTAPT